MNPKLKRELKSRILVQTGPDLPARLEGVVEAALRELVFRPGRQVLVAAPCQYDVDGFFSRFRTRLTELDWLTPHVHRNAQTPQRIQLQNSSRILGVSLAKPRLAICGQEADLLIVLEPGRLEPEAWDSLMPVLMGSAYQKAPPRMLLCE